MNAPSIPAPPADPNLQAEQDRAQADLVKSLQGQASGDMASLMARYGTQLALAGTAGGSPLAPSAAGFGGVQPVAR